MPQPQEVMAFRKRLKSAGYADIQIWQDNSWPNRNRDLYNVVATEPLAGKRVSASLTALQMYHAFKRERGILSGAYSKSGDGLRPSASPAFVFGGGIPSSEYPSGIRDTVRRVTFSTGGLDAAGEKE